MRQPGIKDLDDAIDKMRQQLEDALIQSGDLNQKVNTLNTI